MSDGFTEFGFGDGDDGIGVKSEKFKGETNHTYRVSFAWWPGLDEGQVDLSEERDGKRTTCKFVAAKRHYFEGVGYVLDGGPEFTKVANQAPRTAIGTVLIVWPTDSKGVLDKDRLKKGDFKVVPWIFSEDKYGSFSPIHTEFHFASHDLQIKCTDTKYQKMTFIPCGNSLLKKLVDSEKAASHVKRIVEQTLEVVGNLKNEIGRKLTLDELREKLGQGGAVSAAGTGEATADIDGMLDDMLDLDD